MPYADVAVDAPIRGSRTFTYSIPHHMSLAPGQMTQVPFGPRFADGIVFALSATTNIDPVKPIAKADHLGPILTVLQLELARWISDYYMASLYSAAALMLPPGARNRTRSFVHRPGADFLARVEKPLQEQLLAQFSGRCQRIAEDTLRAGVGQKHQRAIDRLMRQGVLHRSWPWRRVHATTFTEVPEPHSWSDAEVSHVPTIHQRRALEEIISSLRANSYAAHLLLGVTGSGKTEVYLQAVAKCIEGGRKAIVLVPEISLTPQTVRRFQARFPEQVAVIHSRLSAAEHRRTWWGIQQGRYHVVVGSRSALFAPICPLGLIVVDEEHEWTYKQQDVEPRYHARAVAMQLARLWGATLLMGSATPDVAVYHRAVSGQRLKLLELPYRVGSQGPSDLARVQLVDMRKELREGHRGILSRPLQSALNEALAKGEQAILFINRRGDSGIVQCRDCGHVMQCRSCDVALTYHSATQQLVCHQCNRRRRLVNRCPNCRSPRIRNLGLGTQRVVSELESQFPGVSVLRWDRDVAAAVDAHERVLEAFAKGEGQVLVGTQMVTKSLHIPSVTLVGVVLADIGLHLPDFRSGERVFQLICQVAGRAGRGAEAGAAVVQTYRPEHYAVALGSQQDYAGFYRSEIAFRYAHGLPPFSRLIRLVFAHTNAAQAEREAARMGRTLRHQRSIWGLDEVHLLGPAPAYPIRVRGRYRWHILLRGPDPRILLDKAEVPDRWVVDVDPVSVL